jgi:hypothetical protein
MSDSDLADSQERDTPEGRRRHVLVRVLAGAPEQLAGTLYGTIVVLAIIAAGSTSHAAKPWDLVDLVASSTIVLWIAHVYAHGVADSVREGHRLKAPELRGVAWREAAIVLAAVFPIVALMLGALHVMPENSAVWLAIGLCLVTLAIEALRYARLERLGRTATVLTTGMNLFIGVLIVALKIQMGH